MDDYVANQASAIEASGVAGRVDRAVENLVERSHALRAFNVHVALAGAVLQVF